MVLSTDRRTPQAEEFFYSLTGERRNSMSDCNHVNVMQLFSTEDGAIHVEKCEDCGEYIIALSDSGVTEYIPHDELLSFLAGR